MTEMTWMKWMLRQILKVNLLILYKKNKKKQSYTVLVSGHFFFFNNLSPVCLAACLHLNTVIMYYDTVPSWHWLF